MLISQGMQSNIVHKLISKINIELSCIDDQESLDEFLKKYEITLDDDKFPVYPKKHKILVIGALAGKKDNYLMVARKMGIPSNQIEFVNDYDDIKHYNTAKLEYSNEYSDIIYGPCPHKMTNMGDTSSFLATLKNEPDKYPKVIEAIANNVLKLSIESFKKALLNTRLLNALNSN